MLAFCEYTGYSLGILQAASGYMIPFEPLFRNRHLQTIAGYLWARDGEEARFPLDRRLFQTEPGVEVLVQSQRPAGAVAGEIVAVHGLEGSGESGYARSFSGAA